MLNNLFVPLIISLSISIIFIKVFFIPDPDMWWHLNVGRSIIESKGILFTDIYSYTMPNYYWVDWEWLLNILYFLLYKLSNNNFILLFIVFCIINLLAFYCSVSYLKKNIIFYLGILFSIISSLACLGLRAQAISLLFTSIVCYVLKQNKIKLYKLLPVLFLIWANMHGAFILILAILFFDLVFTYKKYKLFKYKFIIYSLCFLLTFVTPYGINLYIESFKVILNTKLHEFIVEFQYTDPLKFIPFCIFTGILYYGLFKKFISKRKFNFNIKKWELIMILICTYFAFKSKRHIGLFTLISLPTFIQVLNIIISSTKPILHKKSIYYTKVFCLFFLLYFNIYLVLFYPHKSIKNYYPYKALEYIKQNNIKENILAEYHWGGFLAWQNPSMKVFIDGRMPIWNNILDDYMKAIKYDESIINKYNVKYILRPQNTEYNDEYWKLIYKDELCILLKKLSK